MRKMDGHRLPGYAGFARAMKAGEAIDDIDNGIAAIEAARNGVSATIRSARFFRFPDFMAGPASA
jgi:hypothetical protein